MFEICCVESEKASGIRDKNESMHNGKENSSDKSQGMNPRMKFDEFSNCVDPNMTNNMCRHRRGGTNVQVYAVISQMLGGIAKTMCVLVKIFTICC